MVKCGRGLREVTSGRSVSTWCMSWLTRFRGCCVSAGAVRRFV